jgi:hypothetical protein
MHHRPDQPTTACMQPPATGVALGSVAGESGAIALTLEPGFERPALVAASMLADILGDKVRLGAAVPAATRLHLHVGPTAPESTPGVPTLWIPPCDSHVDVRVRLTTKPWTDCPLLDFRGLGWNARVPLPAQSREIAEGNLCAAVDRVWRLDAQLPELFAREVLRHGTAEGDMRTLLSAQVAMRAILSRILTLAPRIDRAISLLTVDAEDQRSYFINRRGQCSNVRGAPDDDLQFAKCCRTIMERCEAHGLKAIFMVTGDEIHPSFTDAFGDPLVGLEDNRRVLDEMPERGHDVACHGFDHEWWLTRGRSAIAPMTLGAKLRYFAETSGDLRILFGLAMFLLANAPSLARARKAARRVATGEPFTIEEMRNDLEQWMACTGQSPRRFLIRYPGYVRSAATLEFLDRRFEATMDSSDLYDVELGLPAYPYTLLSEAGGTLRRTRVTEIPCVWIDKLLRTRDTKSADEQLMRLERLTRFPDSILSFVTHTKVLGSTWGHCHVYLANPLKGLALPADQVSWNRFADLLSARTMSCNRRDLESALYGARA